MSKVVAWGILVVGFIASVISVWPEKTIQHPPGVLCPDPPIQENIDNPTPWLKGDFMITPLAKFRLKALVLSRENYYFGRESDLSPVDFALGWGRMSDQTVIDQISISQGSRRYRWKTSSRSLPRTMIETNSANMHIIPASEEVENKLDEVYRGSIVTLSGFLVKVTADGGWRWKSSLTRNDVGDGACELVWVENILVD